MPLGLGVSSMVKFPSDEELKEVRNRLNKSVASRPLPANASSVDRIKYMLCEKFVIYKNNGSITQRAMAKIIGIDEALISKILHYRFEEFSSDRLISYLSKIYPEVNIRVDVA